MRDLVCNQIEELRDSPPEKYLNGAVDCHLRPSAVAQKFTKKCHLCTVHENIEVYEGIIFHFVKSDIRAMKLGKGARAAITSEEEKKLEERGVFLLQDQRKGVV